MVEMHVNIWVPSKVSGRKRKMVDMELKELYRKTDTTVLHDWKLRTTTDSWLMAQKGFRYLPEIIDSATFLLIMLSDRYNIDLRHGIFRLIRNTDIVKEGIRETYPHAAELMEKVDAKVKRIKGLDEEEYYFCWPVNVIGLKDVMAEVEKLLNEEMFSKNDPEDREMVFEWLEKFSDSFFKERARTKSLTSDEVDEWIERWNKHMERWGKFFKGAYDIHRKYNAEMWFLVVSA